MTTPYEQPTVYHLHAQRYLREAQGNKKKALRELSLDAADAPEQRKPFYAVTRKILEKM